MKIGRGLRDLDDSNVLWKLRVERTREYGGLVGERDAGTRDLPARVHAGVGATGAMHRDRRPFKPCERVLEKALDRLACGLALPADEPCAVVREREFQRAHDAATGHRDAETQSFGAASIFELQLANRTYADSMVRATAGRLPSP